MMTELYFINHLIAFHGGKLTSDSAVKSYKINVYGTTIKFHKEYFMFDNTSMIWDDEEPNYKCRYPKNDKEFANVIKELKYIGSDKFVEDYETNHEGKSFIGDLYL